MYFLTKLKRHHIPEPPAGLESLKPSIVLIHPKLSPDAGAFLTKMIQAFQWPSEVCHHIEITKDLENDYSSLWRQPQLTLVWIFDLSPDIVGLQMNTFKYQLLDLEPMKIYVSDSIEMINSKKELKQKVWTDLKIIKITEES